jgi:hypothetical protein
MRVRRNRIRGLDRRFASVWCWGMDWWVVWGLRAMLHVLLMRLKGMTRAKKCGWAKVTVLHIFIENAAGTRDLAAILGSREGALRYRDIGT